MLAPAPALAHVEVLADVVHEVAPAPGEQVVVAVAREQSFLAELLELRTEDPLRLQPEPVDERGAGDAEELDAEDEVARHGLEGAHPVGQRDRVPARLHGVLVLLDRGVVGEDPAVGVRVAAVADPDVVGLGRDEGDGVVDALVARAREVEGAVLAITVAREHLRDQVVHVVEHFGREARREQLRRLAQLQHGEGDDFQAETGQMGRAGVDGALEVRAEPVGRLAGDAVDEVQREVAPAARRDDVQGPSHVVGAVGTADRAERVVVEGLEADADTVDPAGQVRVRLLGGETDRVDFDGDLRVRLDVERLVEGALDPREVRRRRSARRRSGDRPAGARSRTARSPAGGRRGSARCRPPAPARPQTRSSRRSPCRTARERSRPPAGASRPRVPPPR